MLSTLRSIAGRFWPALALAAAGGLAVADALKIEPDRLKVKRQDVPLNGFGDRLAGLRLAQLSDLHVGGVGWRRDTIAAAIDRCNREELDAIALTGDLIGGRAGVEDALELLSELRTDVPRLAVLGNHDHVHGRLPLEALLRGLDSLGIVLLRNASRSVDLRLGRVWFVGVDDGYSMRDDLEVALGSLGPDDAPRLLLTHYPDVAERLRPGAFQLSLAGHSHAGQLRLPVLADLVCNGHARTRYSHGLYLVNGNPLYVSAGLGLSGVPMRFRNWPEITILRFVPSPSVPSCHAHAFAAHN